MKDLFSSLKTRLLGGGGQQAFASQENKLYREEELLNNCNFDSLNKNDLQGGDLYLSTVTSAENHIGGGKLSKSNIWCATLCSNEGGEGYLKSFASKTNQLMGGELRSTNEQSFTSHYIYEGGGRLICHLRSLMFKPSVIGGVF